MKSPVEKKENHPPVSYRPIIRTPGTRSRDPSPVLDREKPSTDSSYNFNRLYPRPYTGARSMSRERTDSVSSTSSTTIPKYTGRSSLNKDDYSPKSYLGRTSRNSSREDLSLAKYKPPETKQDLLTSRFKSKEDLSTKYKSPTSSTTSSTSSARELGKYQTPSRAPSREDLSSKGPQKFITSRFLPKNSIEKSHTAYLRTSTARTSEVSRKNRELLNALSASAHSDKSTSASSRSVSRCSSVAPEEIKPKITPVKIEPPKVQPQTKKYEIETVSVVTRSTSPNPPSQSSYLRTRRSDLARIIEKQISRPKDRGEMVDKSIQSDRMDDTTKSSRFSGASRISAAPWSSFLDLKYSSPNTSSSEMPNTEATDYKKDTKVISRNNSSKCISRSSSKSDLRRSRSTSSQSDSSQASPSPKSKATPPKTVKLPPSEKTDGPSMLHSLNTPNKDFRKSVLNMNPEKLTKRSNSVTSDSDAAEDQKSKLPQRVTSSAERGRRSESSSSERSSSSKSSDDETKLHSIRLVSPDATSAILSSADELSLDKPKIKVKGEKDHEAKSFLMRALAPVTNFFKVKGNDAHEGKSHESSDRTSKNIPDLVFSNTSTNSEEKRPILRQIKAEDRTWWFEDSGEETSSPNGSKLKILRQVESGELAWWLDDKSEVPQGVEVIPATSFGEDGVTEDGRLIYKLRNDSEDHSWFLDSSSDATDKNISDIPRSLSDEHEHRSLKLIQQVDSKEKSWWLEDDPKSNSASNSSKPKVHRIQHVQSGERAWWLDDSIEVPDGVMVYPATSTDEKGVMKNGKIIYKLRKTESTELEWWLSSDSYKSSSYSAPHSNQSKQNGSLDALEPEFLQKYKIRHIDSGERAWWMCSNENINEAGNHNWKTTPADDGNDEFDPGEVPLGDRASPEGLETPREDNEAGRMSPYDNVPCSNSYSTKQKRRNSKAGMFISKHTNIDDILGGSSQLMSPLIDRIFNYQTSSSTECDEIDASQVKIHEGLPKKNITHKTDGRYATSKDYNSRLDDAALQLYKDGDYGSYLDLDASISEQQEEFEGFHTNKKNSIVLRTQLSVRVHTIIEKLLNSEGRELRRALFSLKQIFQEDKDLVHEFVQNDGLACLIKVGSEADQNYQNYILRALGQVMLYVDGMNGVMEHNETVQWLYTLISSKFRLVVKTALKLLLVFVEYTDNNCMLLIRAVHTVDSAQGLLAWNNIMTRLKDFDSADTELLIYATTLINKCLNGVPDQDTYYDQTDALEEQGIENIIQRYMSKPGTDLDLLQQFQIYEAVLQYEDGEDKTTSIKHLDETIRKTLRSRKSLVDSSERRKSRRHSTGNTPLHHQKKPLKEINVDDDDDESSSSSQSSNGMNHNALNGSYKDPHKVNDAGVTPALRRRLERAERQRSFLKEQQENARLISGVINKADEINSNGNYTNGLQQRLSNGNSVLNRNSRKDLTPFMNAVNKLDTEESALTKQPWIMYEKERDSCEDTNGNESVPNNNENERNFVLLKLKKENTVKDLTQKLVNQNIILHSPPAEDNKLSCMEGMTGLINKAKEGLAKSKSQSVVKSPTNETATPIGTPKPAEVKKSENELRWEELIANINRPLNLCDIDFTDLAEDDETDILAPVHVANGVPPPPPPIDLCGNAPPPPPRVCIPPPVPNAPMYNMRSKQSETKIPIKKNKKTVKLFWREVREDPVSTMKLKTGYIWDELNPVAVDTQKLEHLFESRAKDLISKKQQEINKNKEIIVLDPKRSNAINIGMTKLPPPRSIKTAILKMDATIMNREGIEKLLTMLPTDEERTKIQEAQTVNPEIPLGSAEQFLLTLSSISELPARLKLWAFKLDFENIEREIAEPLMDLKQGFEILRANKTFRAILGTLLSIGNFLNGNEVKGFQIEYLSKVPEVKDTVHKHSLLHHLCHIVMEKFPDASDLYSEIGATTRASKIDYDELTQNIHKLEADCKASWDHLKLIAKHDGLTMKTKMSEFLADCAERIILLGIIHRRVLNRFHRFLLWLGIPLSQISDTKPSEFCRIVSEFALEYRTTRERVLQQLEKKANHRERNKTRGKMITETPKFRSKEDKADAELRQLLGSDYSDMESLQGTLPLRRHKKDANRSFMGTLNGHLTDGDDEILESLVKTATKTPSTRTAPRERKRTRHADRKSLKRSRTRENPFGHRDSP